MEMIEIDPKLFVTCRLCLDNLGVYQIVPSVQQQIKFCYDIEVDPFDRLPQLICKSCESVLSKYSEIKKNYVNKQKTLRTKSEIKAWTPPISAPEHEHEPEQDTVSSTQQFITGEKDKKERNEEIICDASSVKSIKTNTETSAIKTAQNKKNNKCTKKPSPDLWEMEYDKWFMCRLCNKCCKTRYGMVKHVNTHSSLLNKYRTCIDKTCSVKLKKADNKPNLCNSEQIVVLNIDKFISSDNPHYFTLFKQKRMFDISDDEVIETMSVQNNHKSPESSDSEPVFKGNKRKRIRLLSKSSEETIVLENNTEISSIIDTNTKSQINMIINDDECISLDDSSDTASCKSDCNTNNILNKNSLTSSNQNDCEMIQNIISLCYKKFVKQYEKNASIDATKNVDSSLKHKALSFGRKIINNSGINCIGILRYLEYRNLDVVWIPRLSKNSNKKSDHVQIMIKLKNPEGNSARDCGWTVLPDLRNPVGFNTLNLSYVNCVQSQTLNENLDAHPSSNMLSNEDNREEKNESLLSKQATLCPTNSISEKDLLLKKLLNSNPVENPKQLRKKSNAVSNKEKGAETAGNELHMPVVDVLSTISQAPVAIENDIVKEQDKTNEETMKTLLLYSNSNIASNASNRHDERVSVDKSKAMVKNAQWIKVKPVTELMSDRALNTMNKQKVQASSTSTNHSININLPYQNSSNIVFMNTVSVPQVVNVVPVGQRPKPVEMLCTLENRARGTSSDREFVVMDTVGLPSTKTDSPFIYFQMLLKINKIIFLEGNAAMQNDFHCLIKFKLVFQQEATIPVVLCLSLYCSKPPNSVARFCIIVTDTHNKEINVSNLSANWQWEILKVYGGDMATKILQNAQKVSQLVYDCTKTFVSLLNEIKLEKLP